MNLFTSPEIVMVGKLVLAAILGGLVGFEREKHNHPAGLKTHTIVSIGACLMMLLSLYMHTLGPQVDPGRIAAQVVTGIGFLCAGTIMRSGMSVKGLTTAACLWTSAGIGLAVGAGYWQAGVTATILTLGVIVLLNSIEKKVVRVRARIRKYGK